MSNFMFTKAEKRKAKLRLGLIGPSGSGKTWSALAIAAGLGGKVAVIDTERGSASLYAPTDKEPGPCPAGFDVLDLESHAPQEYAQALQAAEAAGYSVIVIDSLSHAWMGRGGALEQVDNAAKRSKSGNSFAGWREVTPVHNALVDAMLQSRCHIIATMRSKTEWVLEKDERGKQVPRKVGLAPIQRDGMEYEFTIVGDIDPDHNLIVSKSRVRQYDGAVIHKPGEKLGRDLKEWVENGAEAQPSPKEVLDSWYEWLDTNPNLEQFNAKLPELAKLTNGVKAQVKQLISTHAAKVGLVWDKAAVKYVHAPSAA